MDLLKFINEYVSRIVPLKNSNNYDEKKTPAYGYTNWRSRDDTDFRTIEWLNDHSFGFNWKDDVIAIDIDSCNDVFYFEHYLKTNNHNCYVLQTKKGKQFIFKFKNPHLYKNTSNNMTTSLLTFDVRLSTGYSAIKLHDEPIRSLHQFSEGPLTYFDDLEIFKEGRCFRTKKSKIGKDMVDIESAFKIGDNNTHDFLLRYKRICFYENIDTEDFIWSATLLKSFLLTRPNLFWLKNYYNWDTQIKAYETEKTSKEFKRSKTEFESKQRSLKQREINDLFREINNDFNNSLIFRDKKSRTIYYLNRNNFLSVITMQELLNVYINSKQFLTFSRPQELGRLLENALSTSLSAIIDYNALSTTRNIIFENGYLDLETHKFVIGSCKEFSRCAFPIKIDMSIKTPIWDELFAALEKKWGKDLTIAFMKNTLDYHSRDRFGTIFEGQKSTGKSQFIEFIAKVLDEFAKARNLGTITDQNSDLAIGKALIIYGNEVASKFQLHSESLKSTITRDTQQVRPLYNDPFDLKSIATILYATNSRVNLSKINNDDGLARRIFYYVWDSFLFEGKPPKWFGKNHILTEQELTDIFSGWIKIFQENPQIQDYQKVVNSSAKNIFAKALVEQESVYVFMNNLFNELTHNGTEVFSNHEKLSFKNYKLHTNTSGQRLLTISQQELFNFYQYQCKVDGIFPKGHPEFKKIILQHPDLLENKEMTYLHEIVSYVDGRSFTKEKKEWKTSYIFEIKRSA